MGNYQCLTEDQITAIKGKIVEGYIWAAKDEDDDKITWFYKIKPMKTYKNDFYKNIMCFDINREEGCYDDYVMIDSNCLLYDFIQYDNSPVNLVQLLQQEDNDYNNMINLLDNNNHIYSSDIEETDVTFVIQNNYSMKVNLPLNITPIAASLTLLYKDKNDNMHLNNNSLDFQKGQNEFDFEVKE